MEFNIPTTREQMYVVLKDLFFYYRVQRKGFEGLELSPLQLEKMVFTEKSEEQLISLANSTVMPKQQREMNEYVKQSTEKKLTLSARLNVLPTEKQNAVDEIEKLYADSIAVLEKTAVKNGLAGSSVIIDKIAQLENQKNLKIADIYLKYSNEEQSIQAEIELLEQRITGAEEYFEQIFDYERQKALNDLIEDQEKTKREVFKYNNSLVEKKQRYDNEILKVNASMQIRFLDISTGELTKTQLVESGYYADVLKCVNGFYDTFSSRQSAYLHFAEEGDLKLYLDDYYQDTLSLYYNRALAESEGL